MTPTAVVATLRHALWLVRTLARAGMLPLTSPVGYLRMARVFRSHGMSAATATGLAALRRPDALAVIDERGAMTWGEVEQRSTALAAAMSTHMSTDRPTVAVMCRNHADFLLVVVATAKLGGRALLLNTGFARPQLAEVAEREGVHLVVFDDEFREVVSDAAADRPALVAWHDAPVREETVHDLADGPVGPLPAPAAPGRVVMLTSGTSGTPKGAERGGAGGVGALAGFFDRIPLRGGETVVVAAPLFHAWGFAGMTLACSRASTIVLRRRFDPEATLADLADHRAGVAWLVPVMLERIMALPAGVRERHDLTALRVVALSGSAVRADAVVDFMDRYGDVVYNNYSSTEVGWAAIATPADLRAAPGTAGRPPHGTEVRILDEDDLEVPTGTTARILVRNDALFDGYTGGGGKSMVDGFMMTGDLGHLDETGRLFVDGRDDDMIVSGGENVYPVEVETLLMSRADVTDAAVVGVDDAEFGQRLEAFVVLSPDAGTVGSAELQDHVRTHLARHKVPRAVHLLDDLPRNEAGKVVRRQLPTSSSTGSPP